MFDVIIVGAGPVGLEAAILAKRAGLSAVVLDQGAIVNAITQYPTYMTFFTTAERLEIGNHPFIGNGHKPTRKEALDYYRRVVENEQLDVRTYTPVTGIFKRAGSFAVVTPNASLKARVVVIATGYFDTPNELRAPGADLPHVTYRYLEAHPWFGRNVMVVGGGSSAADASLELFRAGANVTLVHRGPDMKKSLKYWIRPDLENRITEGSITAHFGSEVAEFTPDGATLRTPNGSTHVQADKIFLLTGYRSEPMLARDLGANIENDLSVVVNPDTFESSVPGAYVIGSAAFGTRTSEVFIENGLLHARAALAHIRATLQQESE